MNDQTHSNTSRLFLGSCFALISTSISFAVIGDIMGTLKNTFMLTNTQIGIIGGAALWGFTFSIIVLGPLCDALGMKRLIVFALTCHLAGPLLMIFAGGFGMLFTGALLLALGNGTVEAACNPLIVTLYPDNKTVKLNQFHVWFPGGIVIGGLLCHLFSKLGIVSWQLRLTLVMIPSVVYGMLFFGRFFPASERVQSGVTFSGMCRAVFLRPLFWFLFICMGLTASLELGPKRWIPAVLESGGMPGILVLVYITGLMTVFRQCAGPFVRHFSPVGLLFFSAALSGLGLYGLSFAGRLFYVVPAAAIFAVGVSFLWPVMLGLTAERIPEGGTLALAMMSGIGMLISGLIASPLMGAAADFYLQEKLPTEETTHVLRQIAEVFPQLQFQAGSRQGADFQPGIEASASVFEKMEACPGGGLPHPETAKALRAAVSSGNGGEVVQKAADILNSAENYGGRISFRLLAPLSVILTAVFGLMYFTEKLKGTEKKREKGRRK